MKKIFLTFFIFYSFLLNLHAQGWDSVGAPFQYQYFGGYTYSMDALTTYNGKLYVGGGAASVIVNALGVWNGSAWSLPAGGFNYPTLQVAGIGTMVVYNGLLYVTGGFDTIGGVVAHNLAIWNGTNWAPFPVGQRISGYYNSIYTMAVYNGKLYAAGSFDSLGGTKATNIAVWNGSTWSAVGSGIAYYSQFGYQEGPEVSALAVYNGNLYAGGYFDSAGGVPAKNIAVWNGSSWSGVGGGIPDGSIAIYPGSSYDYGVNALYSLNNLLYVGGIFDSTATIPAKNIAAWNGTSWAALGSGIRGEGIVNAMCGVNNVLYVAGSFDTAGGMPANCIAQWNTSYWAPLGSGIHGLPNGGLGMLPSIYGICIYNNTLYIAGVFDSAGSIPTGCIAQWSGPLGVDDLSSRNGSYKIYPNPGSGIFSIETNYENRTTSNMLEIYNILGEKVYSSTGSTQNSIFHIDISSQPSGIYLYRVLSKSGALTSEGKFILQK